MDDELKYYDSRGRLQSNPNLKSVYPSLFQFGAMWAFSPQCIVCCGWAGLLMFLFTTPGLIIGPWAILTGLSFASFSTVTCSFYSWYNLVSSIYCILVVCYVLFGIFTIQGYYKGYYPGTPGIVVDIDGLTRHFEWNRIVFGLFGFIFVAYTIAGCIILGINWNKCRGLCINECTMSFWTTISWTIAHLIESLVFLATTRKFVFKYGMLKNPPAYEDYEMQPPEYPPTTIVEHVPPYQQSRDEQQ
jgi:hypothetical protein